MSQPLIDRRVLLASGLTDFCMHTTLGALSFHAVPAFGATSVELGRVGLATDAVYCLVALLLPRFTDRLSRAAVVRTAGLVIAGGAVGAFLAPSLAWFVAAIVGMRAATAVFWPTIQARMADQAWADLPRAVSAFSLSWALGKSLGYGVNALVSGIARGSITPRDSFLVSAAAALLMVILAPRDHARPTAAQKAGAAQRTGDGNIVTLVRMAWVGIFLGCTVFTVVLNQSEPLMRARHFINEQGVQLGNLILATTVIANFCAFEWLRRMPQLVGKIPLLLTVPLFLLGGVLIFRLSSSVPVLLGCAALFGVGGGIAYTQSLALSLRLPRDSSQAAGFHEAVLGFANALVAPTAGWLVGRSGSPDDALWLPVACNAAGFILLLRMARQHQKHLPPPLAGPMVHE